MLIKFEVSNFEGFKDKLEFNLSSNKRYDFNQNFVEKKCIKKALIYGENGTGKSSLCTAIMDITYHIVEKEKNLIPIERYFYGGKVDNGAKFIYTFKFKKDIYKYEYVKSSPTSLIYEKLFINDELILEYNFFDQSHLINKIEDTATLNLIGLPPQISIIKYIYNNTLRKEDSPINKIVDYVSRMLFFRSSVEGNLYLGYSNGPESLSSIIIKNKKIDEFQDFLKTQNINYNLVEFSDQNGVSNLGVKFENGNILPFGSIVSSGTKTLWLFYCWMLEFPNLSMLIIDEFDAFYHYSTARGILSIINKYSNLQAIITTHNLMLMNNELTRPDCCFILSQNTIRPLCSLTEKEIRKKNNLQKMYIDKEFTNYFEKK